MSAPEITPEDFVREVESGSKTHVLDVRAPQRLANGRVDVVADDRFVNLKGSELLAFDDVHDAGLDAGVPWTVVCGLGNDSLRIASYLCEHGYEARSLAGGMNAWMEATIARELPPPAGADRLVQFDRIGKGALSYLLVSDGHAFVLDPPRHTVRILEEIDASGATLVAVADSHAHADYISGGPALAVLNDVDYLLHEADAVFPYDGTMGKVRHTAIGEGHTVEVGRVTLRVAHTPGHTEGSVTFLAGDEAAFTGDFLFVGSVGRPDLGGKTEAWTPVLWRTIARAKAEWPARMRIYPAHYASAKERNEDRTIGKAFGEIERTNEPFAQPDEAAFTRWILDRAGSFPDVYKRIKAINLGLETVDDQEATELEAGKNQCALG